MTQQMLFDQTPPRQKKRVNVPRTSVLAYQERPRDERASRAVWMLSMFVGAFMTPTSAELHRWIVRKHDATADLISLRRGLSDALKAGLVEHSVQRKCQVSGRTCVTWKVRTR